MCPKIQSPAVGSVCAPVSSVHASAGEDGGCTDTPNGWRLSLVIILCKLNFYHIKVMSIYKLQEISADHILLQCTYTKSCRIFLMYFFHFGILSWKVLRCQAKDTSSVYDEESEAKVQREGRGQLISLTLVILNLSVKIH